MPSTALFKAKEAWAGASLSSAGVYLEQTPSSELLNHVEVSRNRRERAGRCQGGGISGQLEYVERFGLMGNREQEAPHQQQLLLWPFKIKATIRTQEPEEDLRDGRAGFFWASALLLCLERRKKDEEQLWRRKVQLMAAKSCGKWTR